MNKRSLILFIGVSIVLFVLASFLIVPLEDAFNPIVSLSTFSFICSVALSLLVYSTEQIPKRMLFSKSSQKVAVKRNQALILAVIMFAASLIFFFIGFWFRAWYIGWVSFLVGGIIIDSLKRKWCKQ